MELLSIKGQFFALRRTGVLVFNMVLVSTTAMATPVNVPNSVQPGQVEKRFEEPEAFPAAPNLSLPAPGAAPALSKEARDKLEKQKFVLKSVKIEGATVYSATELKSTYEDMIGKKISLLDAQSISADITNMYHSHGYVLSQAVIPAQDVSGGVLKIRVVEGFVSNVVIQGDIKSDGARKIIEAYGNKIKAERPISTRALERYLLLLNDLPGASVTGLLRPSPTEFGAADLVLTVKNKAFEASYSMDNRGSKYIGPWQHTATFDANSLFGVYDHTQLRIITASPISELRSFELEHDELVTDEGTRLTGSYSKTIIQPGDSLAPLQIYGNSDLYSLKLSQPFLRSRAENFTGRLMLDVHNTETDIFKNTLFSDDRLRVARLGGNYAFTDPLHGNNMIDTQVSQGMNIFNASSSGIDRSNAIGKSDFDKINMDVSRLQALPYNFSILASASGQYSRDPLLVAEQFTLGGTNYGMAYDPAELEGDQGAAGKIELRYSESLGLNYLESYQLFTYYDIGRVWLRDVGPGTNDKMSLASAGGGIRVNFMKNVSGSLEADVPLTKPASNQGDHGNDARIFASVTLKY